MDILHTSNDSQKEKLRKQSHLPSQQPQQEKVPSNKLNQGSKIPVLGKLSDITGRNRRSQKQMEVYMFIDWKILHHYNVHTTQSNL